MIGILIRKFIGTKNDREIQKLRPIVEEINSLESDLIHESDARLKEKVTGIRGRLETGTSRDEALPEVFALVREASRRSVGMRHFDVQLMGGIVLHQGIISEMKTGEGKTLVATLPISLNAMTGAGAHLVTVNDYLAKRDAQWMGPIYHFLGLSVGIIQHESAFLFDPTYEALDRKLEYLRPVTRQEAYRADITYGTNNEYGFDYLRDNMAVDIIQCVQRGPNYAIVDEVDSILIDEARTPLIISGPTEESTDKYHRINQIIPMLKAEEDYTIDEKSRTASLSEEGNAKVERLLGVSNLYDISNIELVHHVTQGVRAHALYKRDVDYVVKEGQVIIVDEFTGRLMPGRRWSDGLHQAVEAKEGVKIANENQTLASITFQNYFRLYKKLAGMTGTADTEAAEFAKIYNLDVLVMPPNKPMIRQDNPDVIYRTEKEKFAAIVEEITELNQKGQPALVGTISIEKSEQLASLLKRKGVKHSVLNAKYHEKEAEIIAQAGRKGAVTIATNMAGRGTDILLGGNPEFLFRRHLSQHPDMHQNEQAALLKKIQGECEAEKAEVISAGGLHIIGTERHESRRIDNQLRGRSGRQGDPGSSRFYLSLEDDLMRIFGSDRISNLMQRLGMEEGVPIEHRMVSKAIENAQKKVEGHNFDIRKQLLEYDDVMNKQRTVIYEQRRIILKGEIFTDSIHEMISDRVNLLLGRYCPEESYEESWDLKGLADAANHQFSLDLGTADDFKDTGRDAIRDQMVSVVRGAYEKKEKEMGDDLMRQLEKMVLLRVIDTHWKDHLLGMDYLKEGIGLRGYGQKDPLVEYKREGFEMFSGMMERIEGDAIDHLFRVQVVKGQAPQTTKKTMAPPRMVMSRGGTAPPSTKPVTRDGKKVGRNDPCPCGSGRKYKKCHGA